MKDEITRRLAGIRKELSESALAAGREPGAIRIVGVSKLHPPDAVVEAIVAGLKEVGENRVQEAAVKLPEVRRRLGELGLDSRATRWHFIGRLQSNKAAKAVELFDVIQSVDSVKLAHRLSRLASERGKILEVFVEVNTSGEPGKGGIALENAREVVEAIESLPALSMGGLMTIGPLTEDTQQIREAFDALRSLRDELAVVRQIPPGRWALSMGMSGDFPIAVAAGADIVRIGTALFGERQVWERA
jgi:hypothetical protein